MIFLALYILGMVLVIYLQKFPIDTLSESMIALSRKFKLSSLVAGATFIAVTSSSPEFGTAFAGVVFQKTFEIGYQAVMWSAIFNVLVITGASGVVSPEPVKINGLMIKRDLFFYGVILIIFLIFSLDKTLAWWDNLCFVMIYFIYLWWLKRENGTKKVRGNDYPKFYVLKKGIIGLIGIFVLSAILVELGVKAIDQLGVLLKTVIPISVVACTFWGPGTSIADLLMSINLSKKRLGDTGIVNGIASNTFDIAICLGFNGLLYNLLVGPIKINLMSDLLLIFFLGFSIFIVTMLLFWRRILHRTESWLLIGVFCLMLITQIYLAFKFGY